MHIKKLLAAVSCIAFACTGTFFMAPDSIIWADEASDSGVEVTVSLTEFKDTYFRQIIKERFDKDDNDYLDDTEIYSVQSLDLTSCGISSLDGVEYLTNLVTLKCNDNKLTSLTLTQNTKLVNLYCNSNQIKTLNLSNCNGLEYLDCSNNQISQLNVKSFTNLVYLFCDNNNLTELNVSANTHLKSLRCSHNSITGLALSMNQELTALECAYNQISQLDVSNNTSLKHLYCQVNGITALNLTNCPILAGLMSEERQLVADGDYKYFEHVSDEGSLRYPQATLVSPAYVPPTPPSDAIAINATNFPDSAFRAYVATEACDINQNGWIDADEISKIIIINVEDMGITSLKGIEFFTSLKVLFCINNPITSVDLSKNLELLVISCDQCQIGELDLTANNKLMIVNACTNGMTSLKLGSCPDLKMLACFGNKFTKLDISGCPYLIDLVNNYPRFVESHDGYEYYAHENDDNSVIICYDLYAAMSVVPVPDNPDPVNPDPTNPDPVNPDPSTEPLFAQFIERLYVVALNRDSEPEGKAFWLNKVLNEGFSGGRCAYGFLVEAPEFLNRNLSDDQFIETLYQTFFDRSADEGGKAFWMQKLSEGMTRAEMVNGFIDSTEWCNLCAYYGVKSGAQHAKSEKPSDNAVKFATRLYKECISRQPDEDGLRFWALRLTNLESTGAQAASDFFHSPEFMNLGLNDVDYLIRLYRTFLGRDPDQDGLAFWQTHLVTDMTRDQVLKGFAESQEFTNICNEYGIERGTL